MTPFKVFLGILLALGAALSIYVLWYIAVFVYVALEIAGGMTA